MIVKKVKTTLRKEKKPKAWQIKDLVDYIRHPHNVNPEEKVEYSGSRNFLSNTHAGQRAEMIGLAHETVHSKMPVQHWIFSWKEGEQPTEQQVEEFVDIFLEKMGLQGHQTVFGLHNNTENFHLHIAVNRVNPDTLKVIQPHKGFDIKAAHRILAIAENKQGWESEKNALYAVLENGEIVERLRKKEIKPQQPALDFEHARGEKSAQRMAQERGHEIIKSAGSWKELHENLENVGLRFEKKGSGAIIFVGDIAVKASSVDRKFSMKKLVDRLGKFEAGNYQADNPVTQPEPISAINREEWIKYKKEEAEYKFNKEDCKKSIKDLKQNHISQRKKALAGLAKHGLNILNIGRHFLKHHQKSEINQLTLKNKKKYSLNNFPRFETWLRQHGKFKQADMWRYRKSFENENNVHVQEEIQENNSMRQRENFERYAQAVAADRYRVTCIKMEDDGKGKKTFILDKKDGVTKGFTVDELKRKMPEMLRLQARGENIYYTPLSERKHHILIDDMSKDSVNKLIQGGFQPAALLESSPGNYQCLLTIPKLGTEFDKDVGNRLTEQLNRMYGDPKLSGCIHPHRAPGFENRKPKHRQRDGSYPTVRLLWSKARICLAALELSRRINAEYAALLQAKKHKSATGETAIFRTLRPGDPFSAYQAHLSNIRQHMTIQDASRVDSMIALRMRSNGHTREDVIKAILECAPTIRGENEQRRDWQRYAERTAAYAFGIAGDRDLDRNDTYKEHWRKIEGLPPSEKKRRSQRLK